MTYRHLVLSILLLAAGPTVAEVVEITECSGAIACEITEEPPNPVTPDPNNGKLIVWNEAQNVILDADLALDRVADPTLPFLKRLPNGSLALPKGTIVSSHYLQWDPMRPESEGFVSATITLDAPIFGFIIGDQKLFDSDALVGLPELDYADFWLRGLEEGDWTLMRDNEVTITWFASSPGDWTRLITAGTLVGMRGAGTSPVR
ncbi:MAG: hypothetical protein AAGE80_00165 [Pseudomonadota bacterium]